MLNFFILRVFDYTSDIVLYCQSYDKKMKIQEKLFLLSLRMCYKTTKERIRIFFIRNLNM